MKKRRKTAKAAKETVAVGAIKEMFPNNPYSNANKARLEAFFANAEASEREFAEFERASSTTECECCECCESKEKRSAWGIFHSYL